MLPLPNLGAADAAVQPPCVRVTSRHICLIVRQPFCVYTSPLQVDRFPAKVWKNWVKYRQRAKRAVGYRARTEIQLLSIEYTWQQGGMYAPCRAQRSAPAGPRVQTGDIGDTGGIDRPTGRPTQWLARVARAAHTLSRHLFVHHIYSLDSGAAVPVFPVISGDCITHCDSQCQLGGRLTACARSPPRAVVAGQPRAGRGVRGSMHLDACARNKHCVVVTRAKPERHVAPQDPRRIMYTHKHSVRVSHGLASANSER